MGSFFTNIHVCARGLDAAEARACVLTALRETLVDQGFVAGEEGQPSDRTLLVHAGTDWIAVYDEACEAQRPEDLDRLATDLSRQLRTYAVTILVHDSDVLEMGLFRAGARVDRFSSNPRHGGGAAATEAAAGSPEKWAQVLAAGSHVDDLAAVWRKEKLFAEDTLAQTAPLLGMDPARAGIGFNYADEDDGAYVALHFCHAVRPAHEAPAEGPTSFEMAAYAPAIDASVGFRFQIGCSVRNSGGASQGLSVVAWGAALDQGLLSVDSVELVVGLPAHGRLLSALTEERAGADGTKMRVVSFPDLTIPAGVSGGVAALVGLTPQAMVERVYAAQVHANVYGMGLSAGEADIHIGFVPAAAPSGQYAHTQAARVYPRSRKPLRAAPAVEAYALRPLDGRSTLFALTSFDRDPPLAGRIAAGIIERWAALVDDSGKLALTIFPSEPGARPRTGSAKLKNFWSSARWRKLQAELQAEQLVSGARAEADDEGASAAPPFGFSFGRSLLPREASPDPELPTLALWIDVARAPAERVEAATATAARLMDEVMTEHGGVQALSARWSWRPSSSLDMTPYEVACGVGGQCTLRRSWQSAFVRGVAVGSLWLGDALTKAVADTVVLRQRTDVVVESKTHGLKISVAQESGLDAVEAALAAVLPGKDEWMAGIHRMNRTPGSR